ncbi:MAG: DNA-binding protein [Gammaproteobacteria bacterium]|nr:DNA-binding protein [Gammaproteobacteria bacterium]
MIDLNAYPSHGLLRPKDAAIALGTTEGTLAVWRCTGRHSLKFIRMGRSVRYRVGDLIEYIEICTHDPAGKEVA